MKRLAALVLGALAVAVGALALAGPASAHVTITAPGATSGGSDQEITFRVPVEKNADTVGLEVQLPDPSKTPIASVLVLPVAGWTHTETTVKLAKPIVTDDGDITEAVSEITWKAQAGQGLKPGEFGTFTIIAGQLPDATSLTFPAIQLYSDGSQVAWNQIQAPGSAEPENPAPVLALAKASTPSDSSSSSPAYSSSLTIVKRSSDTSAIVLGIVALVIAALALGVAVVGRARGRQEH